MSALPIRVDLDQLRRQAKDLLRAAREGDANIHARDSSWDDNPLGWALVGSGEHPKRNPDADWIATVRALLDAGASLEGVTLSPDDPKPPSAEVAELLRAQGVRNGKPAG